MFSKVLSIFMSLLMMISSTFGICIGKEESDLISYNNSETEAVISLKGNQDSGYEWTYTVKNNKIADVVSDFYISGPTDVPGATGSRFLTVEGISKGVTFITINYSRVFDNVILRTMILCVKVNSDKTLEVKVVSDITR